MKSNKVRDNLYVNDCENTWMSSSSMPEDPDPSPLCNAINEGNKKRAYLK